ncbi:MAG TPA: TIR domain-containing protein [Candidatus Kapabacteria bacterium]|nr:TIR domain-containing protein [Candidatus Kapabacteria bacterium]
MKKGENEKTMKMSTDLLLKEVEAITGTKLEKVSINDIVSKKGFALDDNENIIGLNLDSSKLTDVSFLKNFPTLKQLILAGNQISDANLTLNGLGELAHLSLRSNKIAEISFLKELRNLEVLDLSENDISDVSSLKDLHQLIRLQLDFNPITILPKEIVFLENLEFLSINGGPLGDPPYDIANAGLESIRGYFKKYLGDELPTGGDKIIESMESDRPMISKDKRKKIFISYSHSDKEWLLRVQTHLRVLKNDAVNIDIWDDTRIDAGMKWKKEIEKALNETKIAVLLISTDFLASDFITKNELPPLLKAAEHDGATILPLILMPSRFTKDKNLSQFQTVNDPDKELLVNLSKGEQERILVKLVNRIEEILVPGNSSDK